jgi:hypothetical protein
VCGNATGHRVLPIDVAHAAQVSFAFLANISDKDERRRQLGLGLDECMNDGEHSNNTCTVVTSAGSFKAVPIDNRAERSFSGKDGVKVC